MAHFNMLALVTFMALLFNSTNAKAAKETKTDDGTTSACIQECTDVKDCNCKAGKGASKVAFCDPAEGKKPRLCVYCLREFAVCSPTISTANQTFACCDDVGRKYDGRKPLKAIQCRITATQEERKCLEPCHSFALAPPSCYDKDGYSTGGVTASNCKGSYPNSVVDCKGMECSITGGACGDGRHNCCEFSDEHSGSYNCVNRKCQRKCKDLGVSCTEEQNNCCGHKSGSVLCTFPRMSATTGKCEIYKPSG